MPAWPANAYLAAGDVATARQVADKCLAVMPDAAVPYDFYTPMLVPALVAGGEKAKADDIMDRLTVRSSQTISYYKMHDADLFDNDQRQYLYMLQSVYQAASNPLVATRPGPRRPTRYWSPTCASSASQWPLPAAWGTLAANSQPSKRQPISWRSLVPELDED